MILHIANGLFSGFRGDHGDPGEKGVRGIGVPKTGSKGEQGK